MLALHTVDTIQGIPAAKPVELVGRYVENGSKIELDCTLTWDGETLMLHSVTLPELVTSILCYGEAVGRLTGIVMSRSGTGATLSLTGSETQVARVLKRLRFVQEHGKDVSEKRGEVRFQPLVIDTDFRVVEETKGRSARIVDVSRSGVSLETDHVPEEGVRIFVGKRGAVVVRATEKGFAARFHVPLPFTDVDNAIVL